MTILPAKLSRVLLFLSAAGLLSSSPAQDLPYESQKTGSLLVTEEMRAHAQLNVGRYAWAREQADVLRNRLRPYLSLTDQQLWDLVPAIEIPRAGAVIKEDIAPPGSEKKHFTVPLERTRGYGINPTLYYFDPFKNPFKMQSRGSGKWYPDNDIAAYYRSGLDEFGRFHADKADRKFLAVGASGISDDGFGAKVGGRTYYFVAFYAFRMWVELFDVTQDLAELYTLTGDAAYAHKAGVLLVRIADVFPDADTMEHFRMGIENTSGGVGTGKIVGRIWDSIGAQRFCEAYDWAFDALEKDDALAQFVATKRLKNWPSAITKPADVINHIEKNLIVGIVDSVKDGRVAGNDGMPQLTMTTAALALDNPAETPRALDWLFDAKGGRLPSILVDGLSRDGLGIESGLGYQMIPPRSFVEVATLLEKYPSYARGDLYKLYPKLLKAQQAGAAIRILNGAIANIGDGGTAMKLGALGYPLPQPVALKCYQLRKDDVSARLLLDALAGDPANLRGEIYHADPEQEREEIVKTLTALPRPEFQSFLSGGFGMGVLQAPSREYPRAIAMNFGPMGFGGHSHGDRLGLHLYSQNSYMVTDLGYPTFTGAWPPRVGWISHTASHNTVMVDDQSMNKRSSFSGKTQLFAEAGPVRVLDVDGGGEKTLRGEAHSSVTSKAQPIYPQVSTYRRCLTMVDVDATNSYYVDVFWVRGGHRHRLMQNGGGTEVTSDYPDWKKQAKGTLAGENVAFGQFYDGPSNWDYRGSGLMFLKDVERASPERPFWTDWHIFGPSGTPTPNANIHLRVHNLTALKEAALANGAPPRGGPPEIRYLVRTREGDNLASQFVSVMEPYEGKPFITAVKVLSETESAEGFAVALEISLVDGRKDVVAITENGTLIEADPLKFHGRVGWLRLDASGQVAEDALIDADALSWGPFATALSPAHYEAKIAATDSMDPRHIAVKIDGDALPDFAAGKYLTVDNHQRSDSTYKILSVPANDRVDIGENSLDEMFADSENPDSPIVKTISPGDAVRIPNTSYHRKSDE